MAGKEVPEGDGAVRLESDVTVADYVALAVRAKKLEELLEVSRVACTSITDIWEDACAEIESIADRAFVRIKDGLDDLD